MVSSFADYFEQNFNEKLEFKNIQHVEERIYLEKGSIFFAINSWLSLSMTFIQKISIYEWLNQNSQLFFLIRARLNPLNILEVIPDPTKLRLHEFIQNIDYSNYKKVTWVFDETEKILPS